MIYACPSSPTALLRYLAIFKAFVISEIIPGSNLFENASIQHSIAGILRAKTVKPNKEVPVFVSFFKSALLAAKYSMTSLLFSPCPPAAA